MHFSRVPVVVALLLCTASTVAPLPSNVPPTAAQHWPPADDPGGETPAGRGTTYYVSSSEGQDAHDGRSRATPWRTLAPVAHTAFAPGDTILFKRGEVWVTPELALRSSGHADAPITYGAYDQGPRPVLEVQTGLSLTNQAWVVLDRLHVRHGLAVRIAASTHITLQYSEISQMERACLRVLDDSRDILVQHTRVHDCGMRSQGRTKDESGVNGEGIYVGSAGSKGVDRTGFVTLRANEIYATTDEGINIKEHTHHILIEHNVVHDLTTSDPGGINLRLVIGGYHTVRGNVVYNIKGHARARDRRAGTGIITGRGTHVHHNTVYNNQHYGLRVMFGSKVSENTIYGNGSGAIEIVDEPELR